MKSLLIGLLLIIMSTFAVAANVSSSPYVYDFSAHTLGCTAYAEVAPSILKSSKGLMIANPSGVELKLAVGASGSEVVSAYIPSNSAPVYFPLVYSQTSRLSIIASSTPACEGRLTMTVVYN